MNRIFKTAAAICALTMASLPLQAAPAIAQQASAAAKTEEGRGGWRSACAQDLKQFCRKTNGGSAKRLCLDANLTKLSSGCQGSLAERRQHRAEALQACAADIQSLCKDAAGGNGGKLQCLQQKSAQATPACGKALAALSPLRGGDKGSGEKTGGEKASVKN